MGTTDLLSDADAQAIRDGVEYACLYGTDQVELDTAEGALRLVAAASIASTHGSRLLDDAVAPRVIALRRSRRSRQRINTAVVHR